MTYQNILSNAGIAMVNRPKPQAYKCFNVGDEFDTNSFKVDKTGMVLYTKSLNG